MEDKSKLRTAAFAGGAVLIVLSAWLISRGGGEAGGGDASQARGGRPGGGAAVAVAVAPVGRETVRDIRSLTGTLQASANFTVAPKVSSRLVRLEVDLGDEVKRGQVVALMEDEELVQSMLQSEAELEVARANFEEARSDLMVAQREYERVLTLRERQVVSEADLESAEARLRAQDARVRVTSALIRQREAALEAARLRLGYTEIRALWEGGPDSLFVGERFVDAGDTLSANQPVISLVDINRLRAVIQVSERDYGRLRVGQEGFLSVDAFPGETFTGRIARIAPVFREASRQARVELEVPNPEGRIKPGMFVRVRLELARSENAVAVPRDAVVRREGRQGVFLVDRETQTSRFIPVTVGFSDAGRTEILEPEISGEVVVVGHDRLHDGASIRVAEARTPTTDGRHARAGEGVIRQ